MVTIFDVFNTQINDRLYVPIFEIISYKKIILAVVALYFSLVIYQSNTTHSTIFLGAVLFVAICAFDKRLNAMQASRKTSAGQTADRIDVIQTTIKQPAGYALKNIQNAFRLQWQGRRARLQRSINKEVVRVIEQQTKAKCDKFFANNEKRIINPDKRGLEIFRKELEEKVSDYEKMIRNQNHSLAWLRERTDRQNNTLRWLRRRMDDMDMRQSHLMNIMITMPKNKDHTRLNNEIMALRLEMEQVSEQLVKLGKKSRFKPIKFKQ